MKSLEEFIKEIDGSEKLQKELKNIKDTAGADAFLKKYDCDAAAAELAEYIKSQIADKEGELSDDDASAASGGVWFEWGGGRTWIDDVPIPERKQTQPLPEFKIIIEDE